MGKRIVRAAGYTIGSLMVLIVAIPFFWMFVSSFKEKKEHGYAHDATG